MVFQVLQQVGFEAGYHLLLSNVEKTCFYDPKEDYLEPTRYVKLTDLCSPDCKGMGAAVTISTRAIIGPDPYSDREPDSINEGEDLKIGWPDKYIYYDSVSRMPWRFRNRVHCWHKS